MEGTARKSHLALLGTVILLGSLVFPFGDRSAGISQFSEGSARIRVEDRPGFTRVVFPSDRPEEISVKPDLDRRRFIIRLPGSVTEIVPPRVSEDHHRIRRIEILPGPGEEVLIQVVLTKDFSYYPIDSLFLVGVSFLENGDFERTREVLFRAVNLDPDNKKVVQMINAIARSYLEENLDEEALRVNLLLCESFGKNDSNGMEPVRLADMRPSHPGLKWPPLFVEAYLDTVDVYQDFPDHSQDMNLASVEIKEE